MIVRMIKPVAIVAILIGALSFPSLDVVRAASLTITITPASGPSGTTVTISGQGAQPSATIDVLWTPWFVGESCGPQPRGAELVAQALADSEGRFSTVHQAEQRPNYGTSVWQGVIYLAKASTADKDPTSNYVCFHFASAASPDERFFPETGHTVGHGFLRYWNQFGGLPVFGYPITDEMQENGTTVQYFQRSRFEWHPGAWPSHYDVELSLLGTELAQQQGLTSTAPFQPVNASSDANCTFYPQTGHRLCFGFRNYWQSHGGLAIFGYPISEEFTDPATGLTVQYFQRQRLEYHSNNPPAWQIEGGLLGSKILDTNGS